MINQHRKARLKWHCRRGMLELDLLLNQFLDSQMENLTEVQVSAFEQLLALPDPELYGLLLGNEPIKNPESHAIIQIIRAKHQTASI